MSILFGPDSLSAQLALPYVVDGTPIRATASLGMATFPTDGTDCCELIRSADLAMYREKGKRPAPPAEQPNGDDSPSGRAIAI